MLPLPRIQALVLSPTRELATQTEKNILAIGDYMNVQAHACIGGKSVGEDIRKLEAGVHIVSGTPGRVFDMIKRRSLRTREIRTLVLDEADEMLSQGFKEQIYDVYRYLPPETQVRGGAGGRAGAGGGLWGRRRRGMNPRQRRNMNPARAAPLFV